jgi:hypothetical protein
MKRRSGRSAAASVAAVDMVVAAGAVVAAAAIGAEAAGAVVAAAAAIVAIAGRAFPGARLAEGHLSAAASRIVWARIPPARGDARPAIEQRRLAAASKPLRPVAMI